MPNTTFAPGDTISSSTPRQDTVRVGRATSFISDEQENFRRERGRSNLFTTRTIQGAGEAIVTPEDFNRMSRSLDRHTQNLRPTPIETEFQDTDEVPEGISPILDGLLELYNNQAGQPNTWTAEQADTFVFEVSELIYSLTNN